MSEQPVQLDTNRLNPSAESASTPAGPETPSTPPAPELLSPDQIQEIESAACPAAGSLPPEVRWKVQEIPGVKDAKVEIVWDPPWTKERMSEAARLQLGIFD